MSEKLQELIELRIAEMPAGAILTLAEILDDDWARVRRKKLTGIMFKKMVENGLFPTVNYFKKGSDRSSLYIKIA